MLKRNHKDLPERPGVYIFRSEEKGVLYIGKALNLRKRTETYFKGSSHVSGVDLTAEADELEYIVTNSEKDALLLEYSLIKEYSPLYNVKLKDDKSFLFLEISLGHKYPGLRLVRGTGTPGSYYFGPLVNARKGRELLEHLITTLGIRCCSDTKFSTRRACVYHYMGKCLAPCEKEVEQSYSDAVSMGLAFLKGQSSVVTEGLKEGMIRDAENLEFEAAQKKKEIIDFFNSRESLSYMISVSEDDFDGVAFCNTEDKFLFFRFCVKGGAVRKREFSSLEIVKGMDRCDALRYFLLGGYSSSEESAEINLFSECPGLDDVAEVLSDIRGRKIVIRTPERGRKRRIVELAELNLKIRVRQEFYGEVANELKQALSLEKLPVTIEAVDISHFAEHHRVGALVHFCKGDPVKKRYRNFKMKGKSGGDPAAIAEVLNRRGKRGGNLPDLIIVDGGAPQLGAALDIKKELALDVDIVALAKKEEEIYTEKGEIVKLPSDSAALFLFQNIRDEVHRRAVTYHRKLREKL